ncbi:MAG: PPC domain-containing protein, partial [Pseudomonadota bacterium]
MMNIQNTLLAVLGVACLLGQAAFGQSTQGNSSSNPNPLGTNPQNASANGRVGATDPFEYYSFTLNESRNSTLELTGLIADASLYLWSNNGTWEMSTNSGITSESISERLRPGTYTVLVYGWTADTNFQLSVDTLGRPAGRVEQLGLIEGTGTNTNRLLQGNVAANESWVDYVFELPETRTVSISAQISTGAAASPLVVPQQWRVADQQGQITAEMPGGTHFVRLFGRPGETVPFSLSISAAPQDFVGNSFAAASYVGPVGDPPSAMVDFVGH